MDWSVPAKVPQQLFVKEKGSEKSQFKTCVQFSKVCSWLKPEMHAANSTSLIHCTTLAKFDVLFVFYNDENTVRLLHSKQRFMGML